MSAEIKIILQGNHEHVEKYIIASSTVTLIKSDNKNILVDTGSFGDTKKLIDALKKEKLKPEDIDIVILTHTYLDHSANTNLFKNAKIYAKHSASSNGLVFHGNSNKLEPIDLDNLNITKDVKIILTPGHLAPHLSVVVKTANGICAICGDAIQKEEYIHETPAKADDFEKYSRSRKHILETADFIITGHGGITKLKKARY
ncbi:MAG: MBL fold metallo-hydrolase [Candidatus Aenigmatarchaeota archaeon]